jgi:hypothetical protein
VIRHPEAARDAPGGLGNELSGEARGLVLYRLPIGRRGGSVEGDHVS